MAEVKEIIEPCPFCGGKADLAESFIPRDWACRIKCQVCGVERIAHGSWGASEVKKRAIAAWNRRAPDPERDELREALRPFAEIDGEGSEDFDNGTKVTAKFGRTTDYSLTLGDFRRASAARAEAFKTAQVKYPSADTSNHPAKP